MKAIQHIAFNCKDLKRQEAFYTRHFGFKRVRTFNAGTPNEFFILRLGSACLELFSAQDPEAKAGEQPVGFKHLAFEVPNLEKAIAALNEDGITTENIIDCSKVHPGMRVCFFNDFDGNRIELMEGYADE